MTDSNAGFNDVNQRISEELRANHGVVGFDKQAQLMPNFTECEENTSRVIPVVALTPV